MANDLVTQPAQLPAHLAAFRGNQNLAAVGASLVSGSGMAHPRISIKGSRFRLQDVQGDEYVVPQHFLDVIVVDANANVSKVYYEGAYNPADTEFKAPDCWSDNGVSPSARAEKPQCATCAGCPHNVWGSKITPNGAKTRACADSRKLAVILSDNPEGEVYELKVPAASLTNLSNYAKGLDQRGIPIPAVITRLEFDPKSDFPKLAFKPQGWANEAQASAVAELIGSEEVDICVGRKEDAPAPARAPVAAPQAAPIAQAVAAAPADPFAALEAMRPTSPVMPTAATTEAFLQDAGHAQSAPPTKRRRKSAAPSEEPAQVVQAPPVASPQSAMTVREALPLTPPLTNAALDDLIANALKV